VQTVEASQVQTLQQKSQHLLILRNIEWNLHSDINFRAERQGYAFSNF
jgi:hypothetical protein